MPASFTERIVESFESRADCVGMRVVGVAGSEYTFGQMLRDVRAIAASLRKHGINPGDRIALIGENHPNWALAYLGTIFAGAVIIPLDPHGEIETLRNFLEDSEARIAFIDNAQVARFKDITAGLEQKIVPVIWETGAPPRRGDAESETAPFSASLRLGGSVSFDDLIAQAGATNEFPIQRADSDIAVLMYTSGTTGKPKGVPLTHGNILAEMEAANYVLDLNENEKILSLLPLFHAYLQVVNLWVATVYGCEVGYLKELTPAELGVAMKEFKPTILTTVPRLWYLFHKKIFDAIKAKPAVVQKLIGGMLRLNGALRNSLGVNLGPKMFKEVHESFGGRLKTTISAGSRFDEDVAVDFHRLGFTILQGYGLTETSGAATATHVEDNRVGSVGTPMHGAEIKIDSPGKDGVGEVLIRGPLVFSGYYRNPEATAEAFTADGWFRSGDLGKLDDGHLYIVGRAKDVIVLPSGKNVHPEDIEVHYLKCPLVAELAVIGVADEAERTGAEKLAAIVVPDFDFLKKEKIANSREAIRHELDNLGRSLPEYQRVRDYIIRAEPLPRTATRKIKRFQLKQELESGLIAGEAQEAKAWEFTPADVALMDTPVAKVVADAILKNAGEVDAIHPAMNLEIDLDLDSLARAETFAALEHAFSTEFSAEEATAALTVASVIDLVNKHGGSEAGDVSLDLNWGHIVRDSKDEFPEVKWILRERPIFALFTWSAYKIFNLFCRAFMRLEVSGRENLERALDPGFRKQPVESGTQNAFLICPNHQSFLDPFVVSSNYPYHIFKRIFHVGASEFFEGSFMRQMAKLLNVVPVNPDTELMKAMKAGAIGLEHGKILNIYPEGERAFDGELHGFKKGAAILATELDLPIVPIALDGLYRVWPRHSMRIRPAKVKIKIGEPFYARDVIAAARENRKAIAAANSGPSALAVSSTRQPLSDEDSYELVTNHLKNTIAAMIDELRAS
ncbi:MAG: AMP-binding protein [Pyrinomonadaceae bacterium]